MVVEILRPLQSDIQISVILSIIFKTLAIKLAQFIQSVLS